MLVLRATAILLCFSCAVCELSTQAKSTEYDCAFRKMLLTTNDLLDLLRKEFRDLKQQVDLLDVSDSLVSLRREFRDLKQQVEQTCQPIQPIPTKPKKCKDRIKTPFGPTSTGCPEPYSLIAGGCFIIAQHHSDWTSWGNANSICQQYSIGHLAAPESLSQLQEYLNQNYAETFWVGARKRSPSRPWKWHTGRPVRDYEWKQGQPSKTPSRKCIFLSKESGYKATNYYCGDKQAFICEYTNN